MDKSERVTVGIFRRMAYKIEHLKRWKKLSIGLFLIVLFTICIEVGSNLSYIRLKGNEKGMLQISEEDIDVTGFSNTGEGYRFTENSGTIHLDLQGRYVDKFVYTYHYEGLLDMKVRIQYHNEFGKAEQKELIDKNSAVIRQSVINIRRNVDWIELYTDTSLLLEDGVSYIDLSSLELDITGFYVKNVFNWNPYRIVIVFLICLLILFISVYHGFFGKKIEYLFLTVGLAGGILMLLCFPATKVGWDEEIHFRRAYELSLYPGGEEVSSDFVNLFNCGIETWPLNLPSSLEERQEIDKYFNDVCAEGGTGAVIQSSGVDIYTTGYIAPALFLKAGRFLHMPFTVLYQFGRFGGLLLYCLIMCLAIRIIPTGKRILTVIALMPTPMFLACCYSYDSVVIAFISLGLSLLLREIIEKDRRFSWTDYFVALACLVWGILPKAVYAPLVLIGLLISGSKFENKRQKWLMRAGVVFIFLALLASFVLPSLMSPSNFGDTRGGDVNVALQMRYVLTQPFSYIKILFQNIWRRLPSCLMGAEAFLILGHWGIAGFGTVSIVYTCIVILTEGSGDKKILSGKQKFFLFLIAAASVSLIWTAFYLTFTVPGSSYISGVQGRYFVPLLLPLFLAAGNKKIRISCSDSVRNFVVISISAFLLFAMIWTQMLGMRCL
ncbi:DUF2142 domain-containing protein [Lacrimispora sp. NSJ-141]|uniref:DUF2142 domain-containing protein n=1 Tax=Lientehia hominis TaxID=2897778 RepID=A0AAP2W8K5_9FIRM|nr:DUF2142 domain-containing protein [Lientehia hominis]MCD2492146.1 DUF2142 domain-containing protein [Lientehia hominis]